MSVPRSMAVGIVVERRKAASQWIDFVWRAVSVLAGRPEAEPWTVLSDDGDRTTLYAGTIEISLHPGDTRYYSDNLTSAAPSVWVALRPTESDPPYRLVAATVDPSEGESFTEAGNDLVEAVPMPDIIRATVEAFVAEHPPAQGFFKRKRQRADTEALARRAPRRDDSA